MTRRSFEPSQLTEEQRADMRRLQRLSRKTKGLQAEVAERTGYSQSYVSQAFTGRRPVNLKMALAIAAIVGVPLYDISLVCLGKYRGFGQKVGLPVSLGARMLSAPLG